jgi:hypothetical protein
MRKLVVLLSSLALVCTAGTLPTFSFKCGSGNHTIYTNRTTQSINVSVAVQVQCNCTVTANGGAADNFVRGDQTVFTYAVVPNQTIG